MNDSFWPMFAVVSVLLLVTGFLLAPSLVSGGLVLAGDEDVSYNPDKLEQLLIEEFQNSPVNTDNLNFLVSEARRGGLSLLEIAQAKNSACSVAGLPPQPPQTAPEQTCFVMPEEPETCFQI